MNICIGGCWHGSKLLKDEENGYFLAKDKVTGKPTTYERAVLKVGEEMYVFWIADDLSHLEANEKIKIYLDKVKQALE
ncbi:hypothetical protein ACFODO_20475 [Acinetobacter sichuanensis]|uniref:Uncharacterized protein n=1 Tax=Acinetobacter sichuanensis TaxID=2136183 RepID=A0A371YLJ4_9GAMM|nr:MULTISPECIES: hypothetical protein [Acinetobacter]MDM1247876.1 hypothetical protein [Acinetobacter sp. R933-2]MDM1765198.1 hypothetical protein [Acinetobacter sp. 226-1]MDM1768703.1 hypothetical protein [Acinetobacter sp. 226-4]MDQ9022244.1 hypothetical protein [Acinetobacter sichuanensis]RFC82320.1 hypothetical protein C9E89_016945 [Acinetobacter sichuanensis]